MKIRILVVDDNAALAENLGELLEDEGYSVRVTSSPFEAIRLAEAEPPDVALLDVRMPEMDGVTLHTELAKRAAGATFVLMTAYAADERLQAAREAGIEHILPKPIPIEALLDAIRRPHAASSPVLIVEDDDALRDTLAELIRGAGIEVDLAGSLAEARACIEKRVPGSIVLDVRLPDGTGIDFAREVPRGVGVVLITGYDVDAGSVAAIGAPRGASVLVLKKPFAPERIVSLVRSLEAAP